MQFGELPQIEGQRVYWFYVSDLPQFPATTAADKPRQTTLKIRYTQKLSNGKFIYTPLIPKANQVNRQGGVSKKFGTITLRAQPASATEMSLLRTTFDEQGNARPRRFRIVDKHGLSRYAYNYEIDLLLSGSSLHLGLASDELPSARGMAPPEPGREPPVPSAADAIEDLSSLLKKRSARIIPEE